MSQVYSNYEDARDAAIRRANIARADCGIERKKEFGQEVFTVFRLPKPENRFGHELTCEVVQPTRAE